MLTGVEINFVVKDSVKALTLYEKVFGVERIEVTAFERGLNEAVFALYGTRFHMLDENPEYHLIAPKGGEGNPIWFNIMVADIESVFVKAVKAGFSIIQPLTDMAEMGVTNAIVTDPDHHVWMLHQIRKVVSFEERNKFFEDHLHEKGKEAED